MTLKAVRDKQSPLDQICKSLVNIQATGFPLGDTDHLSCCAGLFIGIFVFKQFLKKTPVKFSPKKNSLQSRIRVFLPLDHTPLPAGAVSSIPDLQKSCVKYRLIRYHEYHLSLFLYPVGDDFQRALVFVDLAEFRRQ